VATCALRLPAIYGPDRGLLHSLKSGTYRLVGGGESWTNRIHVDDLVTVIERAIAMPSLPPVLCVCDDAPTKAREVAEFLCAREGLPMPASVPEEEVLRQGGYTMLSNQRVQNGLMKRLLGVTLQFPSFKEGM
jgi:nucleoside-diphosphate-sugar epimerase